MSLIGPDTAALRQGARGKRQARGPRAAPGQRMRHLWGKAQIASQSARLLCEWGDADGAVNRTYYAVFGAARAALASVRAGLAKSKKHGTILRRFERHLVQERGFPPALGRALLSKHMSARHTADYGETQLNEATAREMIGDMDRFLAQVGPLLGKAKR